MQRNRQLKIEFLEERNLLAVSAGADSFCSADMTTSGETETVAGLQVGDVYIQSTIDIDGDGFIGPGDASYISYAWFSSEGDENWLPECDIDKDGFIGPGDHSYVSSYWFETNDALPDKTKSYRIVPTDLDNWTLSGNKSNIFVNNDTLYLDARNGAVTSICNFETFGEDIRVTADFQALDSSANLCCGIKFCIQETGEYYLAQFGRTLTTLYYVDADGSQQQLAQTAHSFGFSQWYTVWVQNRDGQLACGVSSTTLLITEGTEIFGGQIGFTALLGLEQFKNISVQWQPPQLPTKTVVVVSSGIGSLTMTQFPDVCRLKDGSLMAVFYVGYDHVSYPSASCPKGGRICAAYSYDEGSTWTATQTIIDTPLDDRDPSIVQLDDGRLLCNFFVLDTAKDGSTLLVTKLSESSDGGKTWSDPVTVYTGYATSSPIRVLSNGTLLLPLYRQANDTAWGAVGISYDQGKTWKTPVDIPRGKYRLDAETDIIELKNGNLYAIQRYQMGYSISTDKGKTWSVSKDVGFSGESPYLYRTSKGVVVMALRYNSQTVIRVSTNDCTTWSSPILVDNCQGAYPSMVERNDGSILILYYEGGTTYPNSKIRARCFSVDTKGNVTWNYL